MNYLVVKYGLNILGIYILLRFGIYFMLLFIISGNNIEQIIFSDKFCGYTPKEYGCTTFEALFFSPLGILTNKISIILVIIIFTFYLLYYWIKKFINNLKNKKRVD